MMHIHTHMCLVRNASPVSPPHLMDTGAAGRKPASRLHVLLATSLSSLSLLPSTTCFATPTAARNDGAEALQ